MSGTLNLSPYTGSSDEPDSVGERYTRALMRLTREVWHPDCTFDSAVGLICEVAAQALQVERVNAWRYDPTSHSLLCTHAYTRSDNRHVPPAELERLELDAEYEAALRDVRAIDACDLTQAALQTTPMGRYLHRNHIVALLDAPVCIEADLLGVLCHEDTHGARHWTREEMTFAASMGDYVAMAYQIARRVRAEGEVRHLRLHDATTDLPNRDYMIELVGQRLRELHPVDRGAAVVHVRIDAEFGAALEARTPTLEDVIARVALQLRQHTSPQLSLARVRADALAFLCARDARESDVLRLAERCIGAVRALGRLDGDVEPWASVGIAFADPGEVDGRLLLRKAEQAAERARAEGRDRYEVFDLEHHQELVERLRLERALREAYVRGDFELHYQPEFDLQRGSWSGAEALLRWRTPAGLRVAGEFIEVAESSDLIVALGRWVLEQACSDAMRWPVSANSEPLSVRVNVAARQFEHEALIDVVIAALDASGLPPQRLCLEITETTMMRDLEHTLGVLRRLGELGVHIALDDFGTGYSSLTYLKRLPVRTLKLDRSFVRDLPHDSTDTAIVSAVVGLARSLQIEVVAEGVEDAAQRDALAAVGVTRVQGWLYARALPQQALSALLAG